MDYLNSPSSMAWRLLTWGMEPTRVKALLTYQFGHSLEIEHIRKMKQDIDHKQAVKETRFTKAEDYAVKLSETAYRRIMEDASERFVCALWKEIHMMQRRMKANG